jgi:hypothetical protein
MIDDWHYSELQQTAFFNGLVALFWRILDCVVRYPGDAKRCVPVTRFVRSAEDRGSRNDRKLKPLNQPFTLIQALRIKHLCDTRLRHIDGHGSEARRAAHSNSKASAAFLPLLCSL